MALLQLDRRAALCGVLTDVLRITLEDALAMSDRHTRAVLSDCAIGMMNAVLSMVHEVLSGFAQDWNAAQPDPLAALPPELVSEIFRRLDFPGRVAVSHVCTSWRRAALSDRALWAEYLVSDHNDEHQDEDEDSDASSLMEARARTWDAGAKAHALSVLLSRSSPLPFRLHAEYVPDTIAEIVIGHMDRMELLSLDNFQTRSTLQHLLAQDFPYLKMFSCYFPSSADGPLSLSPRWAAASRLEDLEITGRWCWAAGCVFSSVRTFIGTLPEVEDVTWLLSDAFPNLKELCLPGIPSQLHTDCLSPLPLTLESMTLMSSVEPLDYSGILGRCKATGLRLLTLSNISSPHTLQMATELFVRTFRGQWALRTAGDHDVLSSVNTDPPHQYTLHQNAAIHPFPTPEIFPLFDRVCELDTSLSELQTLWKGLPPGASLPLPSLHTLRVAVSGGTSARSVRLLKNGTHVDAPALASVSVSFSTWDLRPSTVLAVLAPIVRAFRASAPASVEVRTDSVEPIAPEDLVPLKGFADCPTSPWRYSRRTPALSFLAVDDNEVSCPCALRLWFQLISTLRLEGMLQGALTQDATRLGAVALDAAGLLTVILYRQPFYDMQSNYEFVRAAFRLYRELEHKEARPAGRAANSSLRFSACPAGEIRWRATLYGRNPAFRKTGNAATAERRHCALPDVTSDDDEAERILDTVQVWLPYDKANLTAVRKTSVPSVNSQSPEHRSRLIRRTLSTCLKTTARIATGREIQPLCADESVKSLFKHASPGERERPRSKSVRKEQPSGWPSYANSRGSKVLQPRVRCQGTVTRALTPARRAARAGRSHPHPGPSSVPSHATRRAPQAPHSPSPP